jgi:hypothetical protein
MKAGVRSLRPFFIFFMPFMVSISLLALSREPLTGNPAGRLPSERGVVPAPPAVLARLLIHSLVDNRFQTGNRPAFVVT